MQYCKKCPYDRKDVTKDVCRMCREVGNPNATPSHKGRVMISLDAAVDQNCRDRILSRRKVRDAAPEVTESPLNASERQHLLEVIFMFSSLSYDEAGMVARMMRGCSIDSIADERGQSPQVVHARWKSICKRNPAWKAIASGLIGCGRGRKPKKPEYIQPDLFGGG